MLGTVLTHLQAKVTSVILTAREFLTKKLLRLRGVLTVLKTQYAVLKLQFNQLVQIVLSFKPYLAQFTKVVQLIKVGLISVQVKVILIGQQLLTTVRQIPQRVMQLLKKGS